MWTSLGALEFARTCLKAPPPVAYAAATRHSLMLDVWRSCFPGLLLTPHLEGASFARRLPPDLVGGSSAERIPTPHLDDSSLSPAYSDVFTPLP